MISQKNLILAFNNSETGRIVNLALVNNGYTVDGIFNSGSELIRFVNNIDGGGVIVCGFMLADMTSPQLFEMLPPGFEMLMLISNHHIGADFNEEIVCLTLPINKNDLIMSVDMILNVYERRQTPSESKQKPTRSAEDLRIINQAKLLLMDRHSMSEQQAHRFLQKISMDSGKKLIDACEMVIIGN